MAVGNEFDTTGKSLGTLAERWDGRTWRIVPTSARVLLQAFVTDGDVVVEMANGHPESIRRERARLPDQRLQPSRRPRSSVATPGKPCDGTLNAA